MKLICISDTHGLHNQIPKKWFVKADTIIHAGDISNRGSLTEIEYFLEWFNSLNYKNKIFIAGNHDWGFQTHPNKVKDLLELYPNITYLEDSEVTIDGIKFYGSPWQPEFCNWAFNLKRGQEIQEKWNLIPLDTNVLITHGPVKNILDFVPGNQSVGCENLASTISGLFDLKAHICGHIHYSYGELFRNNVHYINAATCTERYEPIQKPILFEL